jgi:hypothetical protein
VNLDTSGPNGSPHGAPTRRATAPLNGWDDWSAISLPFRQFGDFADAAVNVQVGPEPTLEELVRLESDLNAADLELQKDDSVESRGGWSDADVHADRQEQRAEPDDRRSHHRYVACRRELSKQRCRLRAGIRRSGHVFDRCAGRGTEQVDPDHRAHRRRSGLQRRRAHHDHQHSDREQPRRSGYQRQQQQRVGRHARVAVADLAIVSFAAYNPPSEILVNQDVAITMRKVVTNLGPSAPMDIKLSKTATAPSDSTVTPTSATENAIAVTLNEQRVVDEIFTVHCNGFSSHTFGFTNDISPLRPDDTDPVASNNHATANLQVTCVVPVAINIKPRSNPNSIELKGGESVSVAVLTMRAGNTETRSDSMPERSIR